MKTTINGICEIYLKKKERGQLFYSKRKFLKYLGNYYGNFQYDLSFIFKYFHLKLDINNQRKKKKLKLNLTDLLKGLNSSHHEARKQCFRKISWIRYSNRATTNNRSKSRNDRLHNDPIQRGKWICAEV